MALAILDLRASDHISLVSVSVLGVLSLDILKIRVVVDLLLILLRYVIHLVVSNLVLVHLFLHLLLNLVNLLLQRNILLCVVANRFLLIEDVVLLMALVAVVELAGSAGEGELVRVEVLFAAVADEAVLVVPGLHLSVVVVSHL